MSTGAAWWLIFNFISIIILAFYSMIEMACVSFNRVRLQYYVSKGNQKATWLQELLESPSKLFGTTLIGVNVAMVAGSECSREFHQAIGLPPDLAPLTQVIIVLIFGELAPMFAARHYPEHVAMLGAPILYASAKLLTPFIWIVTAISRFSIWLLHGKETEESLFISQEELLKILESQGEGSASENEQDEFNLIASNIFNLRFKTVRQIMTPLETYPKIPTSATVENIRALLKKNKANYIPLYHKDFRNIMHIVYPRDLLRATDNQKARNFSRQPWFVTENTSVTQILHQFKRNHQSVAVILDERGRAIGFVNLEDTLEEVFGKTDFLGHGGKVKPATIIDRTLPGDMLVSDFNEQFDAELNAKEDQTLSQLLSVELGHHPERGDTIYLEPFDITAKETTLLDAKTIEVKTRIT